MAIYIANLSQKSIEFFNRILKVTSGLSVALASQRERDLPFGRNVPRKPRLVGGVKGHNMKRNYLTGKPRPVAGELHSCSFRRGMP